MSTWAIPESLSDVSQFDGVEELRLAVTKLLKRSQKLSPLHDVPFVHVGRNVNLGELDRFLKKG